ncbi:hypothetical protein B0H14DRAFT_3439388 [Mycena olivaceomarginata]|nr:hypothetical protein B0H14DRAFT_3439388 [Mycena olivaceomarginata]
MTIAQKNLALRITNQDLEHQVEDAKPVPLGERLPLARGEPTSKAHDFFTHQPAENTAVFLLRYISTAGPPRSSEHVYRRTGDYPARPYREDSLRCRRPSADEASIPGASLSAQLGCGMAEFYFSTTWR